ncbi:Exosome RNA helicase MTR4 [Desmophyllum pertusum]|uniref:Exosome RNA helicase MTR4 n=1 Tax=Desmophyllum pertusum TaxID=174260 RepID=A0A9W9Y6Z0_9CNID|nr:Exosome RNA helicase MTR4 [Desmophyllum pertusum]
MVELCLYAAFKQDPQGLGLHFYRNGEPRGDVHGDRGSTYCQMEDVLSFSLSYGDELWHVVLYQWLIDNALTDRLLEGIQPSGPAHSNTSPGTRTGIDSKVYTIEGFIENDDKDTESARRIGKVSEEAKLEIDVETYVKSFKPIIMDVVFAWANGASFSQICKMTGQCI